MSKGISKVGVQFYHDLIDELLKNSNPPQTKVNYKKFIISIYTNNLFYV